MRITITDKINKRESNLLSYFLKILYISAQSYIKHKLIQNVERVLKLISFCTCTDTHHGAARVERVGVGRRGSIFLTSPNIEDSSQELTQSRCSIFWLRCCVRFTSDCIGDVAIYEIRLVQGFHKAADAGGLKKFKSKNKNVISNWKNKTKTRDV
jgi:hypothetical protein